MRLKRLWHRLRCRRAEIFIVAFGGQDNFLHCHGCGRVWRV